MYNIVLPHFSFCASLLIALFVAAVAGVSTDCERPPHVPNARVNLMDDESGDLVSVTYSCVAGFRLHGEAELFCDLDTDEWQGEPPACRAGILHDNLLFISNLGVYFSFAGIRVESLLRE